MLKSRADLIKENNELKAEINILKARLIDLENYVNNYQSEPLHEVDIQETKSYLMQAMAEQMGLEIKELKTSGHETADFTGLVDVNEDITPLAKRFSNFKVGDNDD